MYDESVLAGILAASIGILVLFAIIGIAWIVFYVIGLWKVFVKAGKDGWKAIIPYYNTWVICEIVGLEWYWFLLTLLPTVFTIFGIDGLLNTLASLVSLIANINIYYNLAKKFNKSNGWVVLSIFFGWITIPILGYSSSDQYSNVATTPNGFVDQLFNKGTTQQTTNPSAEQAPTQETPVSNTDNQDTNNTQQ